MTDATLEQSVRIAGDRCEVAFARFGLSEYGLFLRVKALPEHACSYDWRSDTYTIATAARYAPLLGAQASLSQRERLPLASHLFDYQRWIVERALEAKRYAIWADTGLGKTHMFLEWARQVAGNGRVLILSPLQVIPQTQGLAEEHFGLALERLDSREALASWCKEGGGTIGICNYEKLIPGELPELRHLAGLVADESSLLKLGGGVIKWNLIKSARGVEYKLSCTATPAPNEAMEYASQASFLEKLRSEGEILWTYFSKDKLGNWRIKPHARETFYRFMASWSIYLRDPARFGFADILSSLPPPEIREYAVPMTATQRELMYGMLAKRGKGLFTDERMGVQERTYLSELAKGFLYDKSGGRRNAALVESNKPRLVADLVRADVAEGRQVLVWTVFDAESAILASLLSGAKNLSVGVLDGAMSDDARLDAIRRFKAGELRVLISKASLIGFGLNFQNCRSMVFSGFDDSFERMYQAIRRAYRFGQTESVRVHVPYVPELEGMVFENVKAKERRFLEDVAACEQSYIEAMRGLLPV